MSERRIVKGLGEVHNLSHPSIPGFSEKLSYGQAMHELVDPNGYLLDVSRSIEEGAYPVFYSNHNQHLNIAGFREVFSNLSMRPKEMHVVVAHSLVNEGQDPKIVEFAKNLAPVLASEKINMLPVAREWDILKLKETSDDKAEIAARDTFHNLRHLSLTFKEDAGLVFFPEATTLGAVKVKGKRPGMVEVTDELFDWIISNAQRHERELVFVPVGMVDTNRIVEPRTTNAHMRAKLEVVKEKVSHQIGIDFGPMKKLAKIVVGQPFGIDDIRRSGIGEDRNGVLVFNEKKDVNPFMMRQVAMLLPEDVRGFYGEKSFPEKYELKPGLEKRLGY